MANLSIVIVPAKKLSNGRHRVRIAVAHRSMGYPQAPVPSYYLGE